MEEKEAIELMQSLKDHAKCRVFVLKTVADKMGKDWVATYLQDKIGCCDLGKQVKK